MYLGNLQFHFILLLSTYSIIACASDENRWDEGGYDWSDEDRQILQKWPVTPQPRIPWLGDASLLAQVVEAVSCYRGFVDPIGPPTILTRQLTYRNWLQTSAPHPRCSSLSMVSPAIRCSRVRHSRMVGLPSIISLQKSHSILPSKIPQGFVMRSSHAP